MRTRICVRKIRKIPHSTANERTFVYTFVRSFAVRGRSRLWLTVFEAPGGKVVCRARMAFRTVTTDKEEEPNPDPRELVFKKQQTMDRSAPACCCAGRAACSDAGAMR